MQLQLRAILTSILLSIGLLSAVNTQAALISVLGGQAINDTDLNVTWLADANYAQTSGYSVNGLMTWSQAQSWVASLNAENGGAGHLGYNDWRLPTTGPINGASINYTFQYDGSTDVGYNIGAPGTAYAGGKGSEMAYLFYNELGGKAFYNAAGAPQSTGMNTGSFINFQNNPQTSGNSAPSDYWSSTEYALDNSNAWGFNFFWGNQGYASKNYLAYALAVRTGQVSSVPIPATAWLLGSGLVGLVTAVRKKHKAR